MKFTELQKYKHDTVARFQTIKTLVDLLTEENFKDDDSVEVLMAADEVYESMFKASRTLLVKINSTKSE